MFKAVALFGRKKPPRSFKDYYADWINTLKNDFLPVLRRSMAASSPPVVATHVARLHRHFLSYYEALDAAASEDVAQVLFPDWRNSLEKPFLWLGDLHPYLLINLLRFFLESEEDDDDDDDDEDGDEHSQYGYKTLLAVSENSQFPDRPWPVLVAWKNPSQSLTQKVEQVECGLRLMVPAVAARARNAQAALIDKLGANWMKLEGGKKEEAVGEAIKDHMEEMVSVFVHANRLRRSALADIVSTMDVYQAALFFEGLAQFLVGFKDSELVTEFERSKVPLT